MIITAWRLVPWPHRNNAFSGYGSFTHGNRWNAPGRRVVYLGESQASAALENIVHFKPGETPRAYALISAEFDSKLVEVLCAGLPPNWSIMTPVTTTLGNEWYASRSSCILAVPTALVPHGTNYLVNVTHPDFAQLNIGPTIPYAFDSRVTDPATSATKKTDTR